MGDSALSLCQTLGGALSEPVPQDGAMQIHLDASDALLDGMEDTDRYQPTARFMSLDNAQAAPIATTDGGMLGFHASRRDVWGFSFQLERNDPFSSHLLVSFCQNICGCTAWWTNQALIDRAREEIDRAANGGSALCSLSGGIDSGVCAVLGNLAIGHKLHCIFIDTGLLRKNESEQVMAYYHDNLGLNLRRIDAREEFLTALAGVSDPAEKERIVTERLMSILSREAAAIDDIRLVIQGTNVTDTLYRPHTGSTIDGLPIIEPVRELFKDEIRQVGQELGMPAVLVNRQPFPGSGLASRIMADVTAERLDILREADDIFRHDVEDSNQNKRLWQYFAALALSPFPDRRLCRNAAGSSDGGGRSRKHGALHSGFAGARNGAHPRAMPESPARFLRPHAQQILQAGESVISMRSVSADRFSFAVNFPSSGFPSPQTTSQLPAQCVFSSARRYFQTASAPPCRPSPANAPQFAHPPAPSDAQCPSG